MNYLFNCVHLAYVFLSINFISQKYINVQTSLKSVKYAINGTYLLVTGLHDLQK